MGSIGIEKSDDGNFFKAKSYNEAYWERYMAARPKYDAAFYRRIFDYYESHNASNNNDVAHDVGTGPGQVAVELGKQFKHVIASDPNVTHLDVAAVRAGDEGRNIKWENVGAEDLASHYPAGSSSLVAAAECLPLLDIPRAMNSFAHLLRPDGTLAVWFYGRPRFADIDVAAACQPILNDILDLTFEKLIKGGNAVHKAAWKRATDTLYSFLDNVVLDPAIWTDVYRYKWNPDLPLAVVGPNACDFAIEPSSGVDLAREKVINEDDSRFWAESWNVGEVREFVEYLLPGFEEKKAQGVYGHIEAKYEQLEAAMGGSKVKMAITWPVVLILATKI